MSTVTEYMIPAIADVMVPGRLVTLSQIVRLERAMVADALRNGEPLGTDHVCPLRHYFAPHVYAREMTIPAGRYVVGKMHRHAHVATITRGRMLVATDGRPVQEVGPGTFVSPAGVKRAVLTLEETVITTYHPTDKTDLAEIEVDVIVPECEVLSMVEQMETLL